MEWGVDSKGLQYFSYNTAYGKGVTYYFNQHNQCIRTLYLFPNKEMMPKISDELDKKYTRTSSNTWSEYLTEKYFVQWEINTLGDTEPLLYLIGELKLTKGK
jgi:hypothetical protein